MSFFFWGMMVVYPVAAVCDDMVVYWRRRKVAGWIGLPTSPRGGLDFILPQRLTLRSLVFSCALVENKL